MKIVFYMPHTDAAAWLHDLARALPDAELREWQPGDRDPADFAIVWMPPRDVLEQRAGLKAIFNLGAGVDAILDLERKLPGTLPAGVKLVRLEDSGMAAQMIEYVNYAALRFLRRFDEYERLQADAQWQPLTAHPRATFTVGVLGLGVLGAAVAQSLTHFGLPVRGYSRSPRDIEGVKTFAGAAQFDAFLDGVQLLVNLLPRTPDTENVLNANVFGKLARGAYLVNVARGAQVVDADLLDAIASGQLAGAMLDVFREEPLPAVHPFWREPRITITPHSSAQTLREESVEQIARKILAMTRGEPVSGIVDPARGY